MRNVLLLTGVLALGGRAEAGKTSLAEARVVVLSTMLADPGIGEWGFAALVEAGGEAVLFDTGARPQTVLENARELGVDLSRVTHVVLSHWHTDHTGGLVVLRREMMKKSPKALSVAHVGPGFFLPRKMGGQPQSAQADLRKAYEGLGGKFVEHAKAEELLPGMWLTGGVPRKTAERNYPPGFEVQREPGKWSEDDVPDDHSLILDTVEGLVAVIGCGHAGVINTLHAAKERVRDTKVAAIIGGLHLFPATDAALEWTASELKKLGVAHLIGAHCTGIEATMRLRQGAGLTRAKAVVGAVGATFTLGKGIAPGDLAR